MQCIELKKSKIDLHKHDVQVDLFLAIPPGKKAFSYRSSAFLEIDIHRSHSSHDGSDRMNDVSDYQWSMLDQLLDAEAISVEYPRMKNIQDSLKPDSRS